MKFQKNKIERERYSIGAKAIGTAPRRGTAAQTRTQTRRTWTQIIFPMRLQEGQKGSRRGHCLVSESTLHSFLSNESRGTYPRHITLPQTTLQHTLHQTYTVCGITLKSGLRRPAPCARP